jgi:DNA-binding CsgD family transcriptional regulator
VIKVKRPTEKCRLDLASLSTKGLNSREFRSRLLQILREAVPFDAACCTTVDPQTLLSTGAVVEERVEDVHPYLFENEYLQHDFNKYADLARTQAHVASLSISTEGQLHLSTRYREILAPAGMEDELRAALTYNGACWGFLTLFRNQGEPLFSLEECAFVTSLIPYLAQPLQHDFLNVSSHGHSVPVDPGILILTPELTIISSNPTADYWLAMLREWEQLEDGSWPRPIRAVCSQARSMHLYSEAGVGAEASTGAGTKAGVEAKASTGAGASTAVPPKVCIQTPFGYFLSLQASQMNGGASPTAQIAIILETARPADLIPLVVQSYGLSSREKEIVELVLRGYSTKELAQALYISAYTVQDHMKSIFEKTGVSSRRELTWSIFSQFSLPSH